MKRTRLVLSRRSALLLWALVTWLFGCSASDDPDPHAMDDSAVPQSDGGVSNPKDAGASNAARDAGVDSGTDPDASMPSVCPDQCELDVVRCTGQVLEHCKADADGCTSYVLVEDCAMNALECVQSADDATCETPAPRCDDKVQNGDETAIDCGGDTCAKCELQSPCAVDSDCISAVCWAGACTTAPLLCDDVFAEASDFAAPHSLAWPLHAMSSGAPRQALGSSFGEYQKYGSDPAYVHSGVDIRGLLGDYVQVVADGNIWLTANLASCADNAGSDCRLYIKASDGRYIYYYSHLRLAAADPISLELRDAIMNATQQGAGNYDVQAGTEVSAGQTLSAIADFASNQWAHVHFNVFDSQQNYDGINPLTALVRSEGDYPILDDEPPRVTSLEVQPDETPASRQTLARCIELSGAVDLIATMGDSFFTTDPAPDAVPGSIDSIGVYSARTLIRNVASGETVELPWYSFDRAPFDCAGPLRGSHCATQLTEADFLARSIDATSGAPLLAIPYADELFDVAGSSSNYLGVETYLHIMTHSWGASGSWDTATYADGLYQVSVEAADEQGNRTALSQLVAINNSGTFDATSSPGDACVRDHDADDGTVPSTLGLAPSFASPDILVVPQGTPVTLNDVAAAGPLTAGTTYDVYVRVHNVGCGPLSGIRVRLRSLPPDLSGSLADAVAITSGTAFVADASNPDGLSLTAGEQGLLGPFSYTPSAAQLAAFGGFRALLAELDAPADTRRDDAPLDDIALDNNAALRNVQQRSGASAPEPAFVFGNPDADGSCVQLVLELVDISSGTAIVRVPYDTRLANAWTAVSGANITHDASAGWTTIVMQQKRVTLPPLGLPAGSAIMAEVQLEQGGSTGSLRISEYRNGLLTGGVEIR